MHTVTDQTDHQTGLTGEPVNSYSLVKHWISVVIHPSEMEQLQENIINRLIDQVCGRCMDNVGYVDDIDHIISVSDDHISPRTGSASFNVLCALKVISVKEGEIIDAVITTLIHDKGLYADKLPITFFAKWDPDMVNVYEGNTCKLRVLRYRLDNDKIRCIGEYISPNQEKRKRNETTTTEKTRKTGKTRKKQTRVESEDNDAELGEDEVDDAELDENEVDENEVDENEVDVDDEVLAEDVDEDDEDEDVDEED